MILDQKAMIQKKKYRTKFKAKWDYAGDPSKDQLNFKTGDVIELIEKGETEWSLGELNGVQGFFPTPYCEMLKRTISLRTGSQYVSPLIRDTRRKIQNMLNSQMNPDSSKTEEDNN